MADAIFISYRRDDSEGEAGRLFDDLTRAFGSEAVFMDVAGIKPGVDFRRAIEQNVASCGVLLAMIGPRWLSTTNADGARRLDDPNDFVALEIASAMKRDVPVIPVLVHEATMPAVDNLPETLKDLAFHNSVELSHARWNSDVGLLIEALKAYVTPVVTSQQEVQSPVHATVPVQLPAPHPPTGGMAAPPLGSKTPLIAAIVVVVLVVAGGIAYFATRPSPSPKQVESVPASAAVNPASASPADTPATTAPATSVPTTSVPAAAAAAAPATAQASAPLVTSGKTPVAAPAAANDPNALYIGTWKRSIGKGNGDALGMLVVSESGGGVTIHAYGSCQSPVCDWGTQPAASDGTHLTGTFSPQPGGSDTSRTALITIHPVPRGMDVVVQNTFESPAGTRHNTAHSLFLNAK